jgi:hypothetical protein
LVDRPPDDGGSVETVIEAELSAARSAELESGEIRSFSISSKVALMPEYQHQ